MRSTPDAKAITLTERECAELEGLARSGRGEHHLRLRARIVMLASGGAPTHQIARTVGCTIGTAPNRRVRYADEPMAWLDNAGDRGVEPERGPEHNARILALFDQEPPAG
jgi:hypothetical protein